MKQKRMLVSVHKGPVLLVRLIKTDIECVEITIVRNGLNKFFEGIVFYVSMLSLPEAIVSD